MTTILTPNPWAEAMEEQDNSLNVFGDVLINVRFVMLITGMGKVPYDEKTLNPKTGDPYKRNTEVQISIHPLDETGMKFDTERNPLTWTDEWQKITLPSLKAINVTDLQALNQKFVRITLQPSGETYVNKNKETKEKTAVKFLAVYADRDACLAAWKAEGYGGGNVSGNGNHAQTPAAPAAPVQASTPTPTNGNGNAREVALKFLTVFMENAYRSAGGDLDKFSTTIAGMIANNPTLAAHFTADSPEVLQFAADKVF